MDTFTSHPLLGLALTVAVYAVADHVWRCTVHTQKGGSFIAA